MECLREKFVPGLLLAGGRYETVSPLNHGSYGMVFLARDTLTNDYVALKCVLKPTVDFPATPSVDDRLEEMAIHARIGSHPNLVSLYTSFETDCHIYLVLEFCANGDLYEAIRTNHGPLETERVRAFMTELVDAVDHLHAKGVFHRDIKPENIFLTHAGSIKLGDFGLATTETVSIEAAVGSDRYMSPEQYDPPPTGYSSAKADIWGVGICLLNVLFSRNPFAAPDASDPLFADFLRDRQSLFDVFPNMSQDTFEVLMCCLAVEPEDRSLDAVRDALARVVSFTTDDETLDEFCVEGREIVTASANREPLRTPSVSTLLVDDGQAFPWAKALQMTPQKPVQRLPAIPDLDDDNYEDACSEDLFPSSDRSAARDWYSVKPDDASLASYVDSALGVSLKSAGMSAVASSKPLPIGASRVSAISLMFGQAPDSTACKSWSDMWDEEEELNSENERDTAQRLSSSLNEPTVHPTLTRSGRSRSSVARRGLTEVKNPATVHNSRNRSPRPGNNIGIEILKKRNQEQMSPPFILPAGQRRLTSPLRTTAASTTQRATMEKWAALGDRRRATATGRNVGDRINEEDYDDVTSGGGGGGGGDSVSRKRAKSQGTDWRRPRAFFGSADACLLGLQALPSIVEAEQTVPAVKSVKQRPGTCPIGAGQLDRRRGGWMVDKDWRAYASPCASESRLCAPAAMLSRKHDPFDYQQHCEILDDGIGDLEWVGGWHDLHV